MTITQDQMTDALNKLRGHVRLSAAELSAAAGQVASGSPGDIIDPGTLIPGQQLPFTNGPSTSFALLAADVLAAKRGGGTLLDPRNPKDLKEVAEEIWKGILNGATSNLVGPPAPGGVADAGEIPLWDALYFIPSDATQEQAYAILNVLCPKQLLELQALTGYTHQQLLDLIDTMRSQYVRPPAAAYVPSPPPSLQTIVSNFAPYNLSTSTLLALFSFLNPDAYKAFGLANGWDPNKMRDALDVVIQANPGLNFGDRIQFAPTLPTKDNLKRAALPGTLPSQIDAVFGPGGGDAIAALLTNAAHGIMPALSLAEGRSLLTTDFTLSAGWGSGVAVAALTPARPNLNRFRLTLTAGSSPTANPTVLLTPSKFDVQPMMWANMPLVIATVSSDDTSVTVGGVYAYWDNDGLHITYKGTPTAGKKYIIDCLTVG